VAVAWVDAAIASWPTRSAGLTKSVAQRLCPRNAHVWRETRTQTSWAGTWETLVTSERRAVRAGAGGAGPPARRGARRAAGPGWARRPGAVLAKRLAPAGRAGPARC